MKKPPRLILSLVFLLVLLPLAFQVLVAGAAMLASVFGFFAGGALFLYICFRVGRSMVRKSYSKNNDDADASAPNRAERLVVLQPSASFSVRYLGVIVACGYT
ncbi:MAG: hypothetical protein LBM04_07220, partial [Opitutaceae bacterium]|nr:hypothetical protein [Opitutaceae bacterium]